MLEIRKWENRERRELTNLFTFYTCNICWPLLDCVWTLKNELIFWHYSFSVVFDLNNQRTVNWISFHLHQVISANLTSRNDPSLHSLLDDGVAHKGEKIQIHINFSCYSGSEFSNLNSSCAIGILCYLFYYLFSRFILAIISSYEFWLVLLVRMSQRFYFFMRCEVFLLTQFFSVESNSKCVLYCYIVTYYCWELQEKISV